MATAPRPRVPSRVCAAQLVRSGRGGGVALRGVALRAMLIGPQPGAALAPPPPGSVRSCSPAPGGMDSRISLGGGEGRAPSPCLHPLPRRSCAPPADSAAVCADADTPELPQVQAGASSRPLIHACRWPPLPTGCAPAQPCARERALSLGPAHLRRLFPHSAALTHPRC